LPGCARRVFLFRDSRPAVIDSGAAFITSRHHAALKKPPSLRCLTDPTLAALVEDADALVPSDKITAEGKPESARPPPQGAR
jgi:hypothetical protein